MPLRKGSYLNDEYTETIKQINELLKEADEKFNSLPNTIKNVETDHQRGGGKTLGWYLTNIKSEAYCFARAFGIEIER